MAEALFVDDAYLSQAEKADLIAQWQRFFRSGFNPLFLTGGVYRHLVRGCGLAGQVSREQFWATTFNGEVTTLRQFLQHVADWQVMAGGSPRDLNLALCELAANLSPAILAVLDELERHHTHLIQQWTEFAAWSGLALPLPPGSYQVETNTRQLLQYAIQLALLDKKPLVGLQLHIPEAVSYA